ncbi:MAG: transposase, partial [Methylococcaceae bacterium]|nr:transposase [Methylococcaceae bacterium]
IKVLREGADLYVKEAENPQTLEKYGFGVPDDWLERNLYSRFHHLGLGILLALELVLFGPLGLTLWAVQMLWIPFWAAGVINGMGHYLGYRNFETLDASTNISPLGILIGGEELHNNHHAYPASAKLSNQWWEFDIGWLYIRLMEMVKLAQVKRIAPEFIIDWSKSIPDAETVLAVLKNRVHVMALYSRSVIIPVLRLESQCADSSTRKVLKKARPWVIGHYMRPEGGMNGVLQRALEASQALATVYQFKQQLSELWTNASFSQESRLEALREWCRQAQETKIQCLQHFAQTLRGYTLSEPSFN